MAESLNNLYLYESAQNPIIRGISYPTFVYTIRRFPPHSKICQLTMSKWGCPDGNIYHKTLWEWYD